MNALRSRAEILTDLLRIRNDMLRDYRRRPFHWDWVNSLSAFLEKELWAVRYEEPSEDVIPMPSLGAAEAKAAHFSEKYAASVVAWPGSPEEHAREVKMWWGHIVTAAAPAPARPEPLRLPTIQELRELLDRANTDSDPASVFALGPDIQTMTGLIVLVRGNTQAQLVRQMLITAGLLTIGKGVRDGTNSVCLTDVAHSEPVPAMHCGCPICRMEGA